MGLALKCHLASDAAAAAPLMTTRAVTALDEGCAAVQALREELVAEKRAYSAAVKSRAQPLKAAAAAPWR